MIIPAEYIWAGVMYVFIGIIWMIRLEGRVNGHDKEFARSQDDIAEVKAGMIRVEDKLDDLSAFLLREHYHVNPVIK